MKYLAFSFFIFFFIPSLAQVETNFHNKNLLTGNRVFKENYSGIYHIISPPDSSKIIALQLANKNTKGVKPLHFAMKIKANINVISEAEWITENNYAYGKFSLTVARAKSLSVFFNSFYLPKETVIYIYNNKGTMITGPVTNFENNSDSTWVSLPFQGDTINIEIRTPVELKNDIRLNISIIGYGIKNIFSVYSGGFGTSASCEINVMCPLGDNWVNQRSAVAKIIGDQGTSTFTGEMIMNTCSTNAPYLLTAWHVLDNYVSSWQFIFQYWSPTCTPTQMPTNFLQFNGATLKASYEQSDFALVQLNQTPPSNSGITYLGWNRSPNAALNTVGIHNPRGDVMKICSDSTSPIPTGFYAFPFYTNTPNWWEVNFQQGTVEPGSSGSALFDQDQRVVGQLTGNLNPPLNYCTDRSAEYGRFNISWTGGGTDSTRLSNWLDPSNSGAMTTNTTNINALMPFVNTDSLNIIGPTLICDSSDYSILNLPAGATVSWSIPGGAGSVLQLAQNTPSLNQLRIINQKWYGVTTTLTATITNLGCGVPTQTRTMTIENDNSTSPYTAHSYYQEACVFYNVSHPSQSGTITSNSSPVFVHQGCTVYVNLGDMVGRTVSLGQGSGQPTFWYVGPTTYYPNTLYFQLPYASGGIPFTFNITGNGACYEQRLLFFSYSNNNAVPDSADSNYTFNIAPNPAQTLITITAQSYGQSIKFKGLQQLSSADAKKVNNIRIVKIFNTSGKLSKQQQFSGNSIQVQINVSKLPNGVYFVEISDGKNAETEKLVISR